MSDLMRVLNLYAGVGGNRKNWPKDNYGQVTAIESDEKIATLYKKLYPQDHVIQADAHDYLLNNFDRFDFIWSSPPCQSHSRMIRSGRNRKPRYPDLRIYEQILFLQYHFSDRPWVVENVVPYYKPLIPAYQAGRHLFWSNLDLGGLQVPKFPGFINKQNLENKKELMDWLGIYFEENIYYEGNHCPTQILRNAVHPIVGEQIMKKALKKRGQAND